MRKALLSALLAVAAVTAYGVSEVFFVDPTGGSDTSDGLTPLSGLRTLSEAQLRLRRMLSSTPCTNVTINLLPGSHAVPQGGVRLTQADSPAAGAQVRWRGPQASVSGGVPVTGWRPLSSSTGDPAAVYAAPISPAGLPAGFVGRHLFVNGRRAPRTRKLVGDALPGLAVNLSAQGYAVPFALDWSNGATDAEMVYSAGGGMTWTESRCAVNSSVVRGQASLLIMKQPCFATLMHLGFGSAGNCKAYGHLVPDCNLPRYVENVRAHVEDQPGSFFFDAAAGLVLYHRLPGEDMQHATAVLAVEEKLISLAGAEYHTFQGISFEHATWLRPGLGSGYVEDQASVCSGTPNDGGALTSGNVVVTGQSRHIEFVDCTFQHLGAAAASTRGGSQFIAWRRCSFRDVSAGAVVLGDVNSSGLNSSLPDALLDKGLTVEDCTIEDLPVEYSGATAVFAGYISNSTIQHNRIVNSSSNAIALGWGWGREANRHGGNNVQGNYIASPLRARCCDGGGIYALGPQLGSSIARNYIKQTQTDAYCPGCFDRNRTEGFAVYLDNGSGGWNATENVIEGDWDTVLLVHTSLGQFGPSQGKCPGCNSTANSSCCAISFEGNFVRVPASPGVFPPVNGRAGGVAADAAHPWFRLEGNVDLPVAGPMPAQAAAIVAASGPRP